MQSFIGTNLTISEGSSPPQPSVYPPTLSATSGSIYFNGSNSHYYRTDIPEDWAVGTGDYTIEWYQWMLTSSSNTYRPFSIGSWPNAVLSLSIENSGSVVYLWAENGGGSNNMVGYFTPDTADVFNTWLHVAISRTSGITKIFFNGVEQYSTGNSYNVTNSGGQGIFVGNDPTYASALNGYMKDFRFIKGVSLYSTNFTPSKYPLTPTAETVLLLSVEDSNTVAIDSSSHNHTSGTTAGLGWSEVSPYGIALEVDVTNLASYDPGVSTTTWYDLTPNGNNITLTNVTQLQQGFLRFGTTGMGETVGYSFPEQTSITPRMSISYWANIKSTGMYQHIVGCRATNFFHTLLLGSNIMEARTQTNGGYWDLQPDMSSHIGNAVHCAFVVNGDRADFYINGVRATYTTGITGLFTGQLGPLYLASVNGGFQSENLDIGYVRVDNRARDPREIAREFAAKRTYYGV